MPRFRRGQVVRTVPFAFEPNVVGVVVGYTANDDGIESSDSYGVELDTGGYSEFNTFELECAVRDAQSDQASPLGRSETTPRDAQSDQDDLLGRSETTPFVSPELEQWLQDYNSLS